jgi:2-dehydropantoate 2-reductase
MTLLLHNLSLYEAWRKNGRGLLVEKNGLSEFKAGYDVNVLKDDVWFSIPQSESKRNETDEDFKEDDIDRRDADTEKIDNLILAVKATQVEAALKSIRHRLTPDSTIVFLQNGMGVQEEINEKIFQDPGSRPNYIVGITSHGLYRLNALNVVHAGIGTTTLGVVSCNAPSSGPSSQQEQSEENKQFWPPSCRYLLRTLTRTPALTAIASDKSDLLQFQLEKLAVNAVINPLTAIFDCINGDLLYNYNISRIQRLLLIEISAVICALPELQGVPAVRPRFAPERLRTLAVSVASKTAVNTSSMLQDVRMGKETEIEYINGYIVRKGEEIGIKCALNYMLMQMVMAKSKTVSRKMTGEIPMDLSGLK